LVLLGAGGYAGVREYNINKKEKKKKKEKEKIAKGPELQHEAKYNLENIFDEEDERMEQLRIEREKRRLSDSTKRAIQAELFLTDPSIGDVEEKNEIQSHLSRGFGDVSEEFEIFQRSSLSSGNDLGEVLDLRGEYHFLEDETDTTTTYSHVLSDDDDEDEDEDEPATIQKNQRYLSQAYEDLLIKHENSLAETHEKLRSELKLSKRDSDRAYEEIKKTRNRSLKQIYEELLSEKILSDGSDSSGNNEKTPSPISSHENQNLNRNSNFKSNQSVNQFKKVSIFLSDDEESSSSMDEEYFRH